MHKSSSTDEVCTVSSSALKTKPTEKIFSISIIPPILLTSGYLFFLRSMIVKLKEEEDNDPFRNVWWSGPITFTILYLIVVFSGLKLMKNRQEFKIKPYIFIYNLYQCILNIVCVVLFIREVMSNPIFTGIWGNIPKPGRESFNISLLVWIHYNNKYVELLDTLWMILRKKNEQVSFLHCYHHVLLIWAWFLVCKIETGGDSYFGACVNSFIHIIMYGYYTLALLNIPCPWKRWITNMQMLQFTLCFSHSCFVVYNGNAPIILPLAQAFVMINMLVLFGRFYAKSYLNKKTTSKKLK